MNLPARRRRMVCALAIAFQLLIASQAPAQEEDANARALAEYRLTDQKLEGFAQASRNLAAALQADPALANAMDIPEDASIEEMAAVYDSEPTVRNAIHAADMTSADYVTFMFAMMQAGMAAWLMQEYGEDKLPEGTPRENVDYYIANEDKIAAMTAEIEALEAE